MDVARSQDYKIGDGSIKVDFMDETLIEQPKKLLECGILHIWITKWYELASTIVVGHLGHIA